MPTYKVTDPSSGKTVRLTGDSAPTEQELEEVFKSITQQSPSSAPVPDPGSAEQMQKAVNEAGMTKSHYAILFGAPLVVAIAFVAFLIYRRKSKRDITKPKKTPGPADFSTASLGVKRLSFVLSALVATGHVVVATLHLSDLNHDLNFTLNPKWPIVLLVELMASALVGLTATALTWFFVRVIDWVIRGFKFGG